MITAPNEGKILEWDENSQINKQTNAAKSNIFTKFQPNNRVYSNKRYSIAPENFVAEMNKI